MRHADERGIAEGGVREAERPPRDAGASPGSSGAVRQRAGWRGAIAWLVGGSAELSPALFVRYALLMGVLAGLAEALYLTLRHIVKHQPAAWYNPDVVWMAPVAAALVYPPLASVIALLARLGRSGIGLGKATFLLTLPGVFGLMQAPGVALHWVAELILSLGIATAAARLAEKSPDGAARAIRRATPVTLAAVVLLAAWGTSRLPAALERRALARMPAARDGMPNVLLIVLDTVRAANLGLYGYPRATSPHLDRWAATGVVFDRAISTAPWTLPSHASMFTGQYNVTLGTGIDDPLDARPATLAGVLGDHGYATAGFVANLGYTTRTSGLHRGFARYEDFPPTAGMLLRSMWLARQVSRRLSSVPGYPAWPVPKTGERITDDLEGWLAEWRARDRRPFFVFLNYYDAHSPYVSPPAYHGRFGPVPEAAELEQRQYTREELVPWVNAYDGSIAYLDDQLSRVFRLLERHGLRDSTLVIVTSDHGEMFGEHGQTEHTSGLYMPSLHVPLVMAMPSALPAGVRVRAPVSLRDLPATILDIIGLSDDSAIPGVSLAALWRSESAASPAFAEIDHYDWAPPWAPVRRGDMRSLVGERLQYIRNGDGAEELYDPTADSAFAQNLIERAELRPTVDRFRATLDSILRR